MAENMLSLHISEHARMAYSSLDADDRRRLDAWFGHLRNWRNDEFIRAKATRLESDDETYLLRTNAGYVIAFSLAGDTAIIHSIFSDETVNKFAASAARKRLVKEFRTIEFNLSQCRRELDQFQSLLTSKEELSELDDLQPLFKGCSQLSALIGTCFPKVGPANRLAYEFDVFGDFTADIVVGKAERNVFGVIELEDARRNSIFNKLDSRATKEWGRRFEHGFGQLVDWFYAFDDHKNSAGFSKHFGYGHVEFFGLLVVGRSADLTEHDLARLQWRSDRVSVNTHKLYCLTYDELYYELNNDWRLLSLSGKRS